MERHCYEELLDPLGTFLASQDALKVEILDQGEFFIVCWNEAVAGPVQRTFGEEELLALRPVAYVAPSMTNRTLLLGQLGREIDAAQLSVARIVEGLEWFLVTGSCGGRYESWRFPYHELQARLGSNPRPISRVLPAVRQGGVPPSSPGIAGAPAPANAAPAHASPLRRRLQLT